MKAPTARLSPIHSATTALPMAIRKAKRLNRSGERMRATRSSTHGRANHATAARATSLATAPPMAMAMGPASRGTSPARSGMARR